MSDEPSVHLDYAGPVPCRATRPRRVHAAALLLGCLYVPYAWLLLMDYGWGDYRWLWIKLWPILPGFAAMIAFHSAGDVISITAAGALATTILAALLYVARRPTWRSLLLVAAVVLAASGFNSFLAYGAFRA